MNLAVVGSRTFDQDAIVRGYLDRIRSRFPDVVIVSGGAAGADRLAAAYARQNDLKLIQFSADWAAHGRRAGPIRNRRIVAAADALVAFWDESSPGTRSSLEMAREKGISAIVITLDGREYEFTGVADSQA